MADESTLAGTTVAEGAEPAGAIRTGAACRPPAGSVPPELANRTDYEIVRELGVGGMGVVYLARNRLMARHEVLKVIGQHIVEQSGALDRFLREIRAVARLRHPNIVSAYSAFHCGTGLVFAMEYIEGLDLRRMVKAKGPMPIGHACFFVHQTALGLQHAHEEGMVHRDIKPANLMLSHQKNRPLIKILDFGLSKAASEQSVTEPGIDFPTLSLDAGEHLTCTGDMLGTPDFIAPEQIVDTQRADIRADIYSLGCTLYYLLSGHQPFPDGHVHDVLKAHRSLEARPLVDVRAEVPAELSMLVARMMAKDPASRFQQPAEVTEALTPFFKKPVVAVGGARPATSQVRLSLAGQPSDATQSGWPFDGLIDVDGTDHQSSTKPDAARHESSPALVRRGHPAWTTAPMKLRRLGPRHLWITAGILLLGLLIMRPALTFKANNGSTVLENVPAGAIAEVDEDRLAATPKESAPGESGPRPPSSPANASLPKDRMVDHDATRDDGSNAGETDPDPATARSHDSKPVAPAVVADVPHPFRIATNGLGGRPWLDPASFGPNWSGFNSPGSAVPWLTNDAFARPTAQGTLGYPPLLESRYVFEVDVTLNQRCFVNFQLGDPKNECHIELRWISDRNVIQCELHRWQHGGASVGDHRDFAPGSRIHLKLVVGDGRQAVFHEGVPIASSDGWPADCCLRITANPDSAVIHGCSIRPLTAEDVEASGWPMPPTRLAFDAREAAERWRLISTSYPWKPKLGKRFVVKTTGTPMSWIPPGTFEMGSRDPKDGGPHPVRLTRGYWMAQTEVTQGEYQKLTNANPSRVTGSPLLPVDWVAWDAAAAYCRRLTDLEREANRLLPRYEYRLPTEAEWEYACRAGSDQDFSVPEEWVWSRDRSEGRPHEVAESQPNVWGLYDMHGNAMEWCFDAWNEYPSGKRVVTIDPFKIGRPGKDTTYVVRGGAWWSGPEFCTSAWRYRNHNNPNGFRGFRIVLGPEIRAPEAKN
jgi:serine/threonine protein kinase/formylglycine-generating enzyme required for sulfatase activity